MEKEPIEQNTKRRYTHEQVQKRRKVAGRISLGLLSITTILAIDSTLSNNNGPYVATDRTYQEAPRLNEIQEQNVPSDIQVSGINWNKNQKKYGAIEMVGEGKTRYIEIITPTESPVNSIKSSDISVTMENRFGFPINPGGDIITIGKDGKNTTIQIAYSETNKNFELTTSRILNEPTIICFMDDAPNGQTYYFGVNPNK